MALAPSCSGRAGIGRSSTEEEGHPMGTFETIAIVAVVYVLAFIAHRASPSVEPSAPDNG